MASITKNPSGSRLQQMQKRLMRIRIVRRCIAYCLKALIATFLVLGVCFFSFLYCMRLSNAYILVNEGMSLRAECILQEGDILDLVSYFTDDCIIRDSGLAVSTYQGYKITDYDYRVSLESISAMPWNTQIKVDLIEQCQSITGTSADLMQQTIPPWIPMRYELTLSHLNGRWYISDIITVEIDPDIAPAATPDMSLTPQPAVTPTPKPTEEPLS